MVMITLGFCSSPKSYFIGPVTEYLEIDRSVYSINDSCRFIASAVVSFFFGMLIKKFGPRKLIAAGFIALVGSSLCYALAENIWILYLGGILLGVGLAWTTTSMVGIIVSRWAKENKGTIMGAVLAANGLGGAIAMNIVSPIIESDIKCIHIPYLVIKGIRDFEVAYLTVDNIRGFKIAYLVIAAVLLVAGIIVVLFIRNTPKNKANEPIEISKKKSRGNTWTGLAYKDTRKKWYFYGAIFCVFGVGFFLTACNGVAVQHMKDTGLDPVFVTTIWSVHSIVLALFKFLTGFIYDKTGLRATMLICTGTAIVVVICLALVTPTPEGKILAIIYSVFSGLALPLETVMLPIITGELFGESSFDEVLGLAGSANAIGYAVASPLMNGLYDVSGGISGKVSEILSWASNAIGQMGATPVADFLSNASKNILGLKTYSYGMFLCIALLIGVMILMQIVITSAHKTRKKLEDARLETVSIPEITE